MADEKGIREALRKEKSWSPSALSHAVTRLANKYHIAPRSDALLALAHVNNVPLAKYGVDVEGQRRASELARMVASPTDVTSVSIGGGPQVRTKVVKVEMKGVHTGSLPGFMSSYGGGNHERSLSAYQLVYLFENSVREVIVRVLKKKHGTKDWWAKGVDPKINEKAENRKEDDKKDPWHAPRGEHLIHYIDLYHYNQIITSDGNWPLFKPIFIRKSFVEETLHQINVSRRVVAHMNGLKKSDFDSLKSNFRIWNSVLKANEGALN